ncbi:MAG TPA: NUDIX domain-containing protein [Methylotenera sp.]|nr:NUDIX domain-containing protein [Methylotenera sp.]HPH06422.1 NUDIX domain-containing protein [Methylotenera sp.]HPN00431.1 NUDIX domain-containing protein [Methylotenera sp.]
MTTQQDLAFPRPLTFVDVVIFCVQESQLKVLLIKRKPSDKLPNQPQWGLVGGFVDIDKDENLEATALRKLKEKTNVTSPYLEQLGSWGSRTRDPRGWSVTNVYFALISPEFASPLQHGGNAEDAQWVTIEGSGVKYALAFDHHEILETAITRLRNKVEYTSLPAYLMPNTFTMAELQKSYEVVLGRSLEKSAFRTRVLSTDLLEPIDDFKLGSNRPAQLYKIKNRANAVFFQRTFKPV